MIDALNQHGYIFRVLTTAEYEGVTHDIIDGEAARSAVTEGFQDAGSAHVYIGELTVQGMHIGDETTPLEIDHRLVYAVQIRGLVQPPMVGPVESALHDELVAFVDAKSGRLVIATTVR